MTWKVPVFDMFYVISQPFFEDIDLKFCAHINQPLPSNILSDFLKILILRGKILKKRKKLSKILIFSKFSKFSQSEITVL